MISKLREKFIERKKYCTKSRYPFYDLASKYLPKNNESTVVDVGSGEGSFAKYLNLNKYKNLYLLDANEGSVDKLKKNFKNSLLSQNTR